MKRTMLGLAALACCSGYAAAADLPYRAAPPPLPLPPAFVWNGFYVGGFAGAIMDDSRTRLVPTGSFLDPTLTIVSQNPLRTEAIRNRNTDGTGGGQLGYNMQFGSFVLGVETDIGRGVQERHDFNVVPLPAPLIGTFTGRVDNQVDYFGTVRGRLGYAFDNLLIYGTGGFAYGSVQTNTNVIFSSAGDRYVGNSSRTETGYAYGGGIEYKITPNVSIRGEYLHVDLGHTGSTSLPAAGGNFYTYSTRVKSEFDVARAALNYHFNLPWF